MRYPTILLGLLASTGFLSAAENEWKPLWNDRDLSGWERWLGKPHPSTVLEGEPKDASGAYTQVIGIERDPLHVFTVVNIDGRPALRVSGQIFGGITTKEQFANFHVKLQFKWGERRWAPRETVVRDSGLLYHVHSPMNFNNRTWPRSIELQIQEKDCGDLYAIGAQIVVNARRPDPTKRLFIYDPKGEPTIFLEQPPVGNRCIKEPDNEKPSGEWNTIEVVALGADSIHIVNGKVVMRLRDAKRLDGAQPMPLTSGAIQLQSEGAELFYRDIVLRKIDAVPAEFAEK